MKNEQRIVRYLDGQMNPDEVRQFESDIEQSEELQNLLRRYKKTFLLINSAKDISVDERYFSNIAVQTKQAMQSTIRIKSFPAFAYGFSIILILTGIYFFILNRQPVTQIVQKETLIQELNKTQIDELYNYYSSYSDEITFEHDYNGEFERIIDDLIISELKIGEKELDLLIAEFINGSSSFADLSDTEIDFVFEELLHTKFD